MFTRNAFIDASTNKGSTNEDNNDEPCHLADTSRKQAKKDPSEVLKNPCAV